MKRLSSKLAAILLVAVMAVSLFPLSSLAETADGVGNEDLIVTEQQTTVENEIVADETTVEETTSEETAAEVTTPGVTTGEETVSGEEPAAETPVEETAPVEEPKEEAPVEVAAPVEEPVVIPENSITSQPQDALVAPNKKAVFEIETNGKVASYQWQYSANGGRSWKNLNSASYYKTNNQSSIVVTGYNSWFSSNNGYKYRCIVTFKDKKKSKVTSDVAALYVGGTLSVKSTKSKSASNAEVSVKAPEATFPAGTTLEVADVDSADYIDAINTVLEDTAAAEVTAVDISFKYDGEEVEPANDNKVTVTLKSDAVKEGVKLVHIDDEGIATLVTEEDIVSIKNGEIVFKTDAFSVYAVIDDNKDENARITVNFINTLSGETVATYYVKNGDVLLGEGEREPDVSYIEDIVTDPGLGEEYEVPEGMTFVGWSMDDQMNKKSIRYADTDTYVGAGFAADTTPLTIEGVRSVLAEMQITEGDIVNIYSMVLKYYNVSYFGDKANGEINMDVSLGTHSVYLMPDAQEADYTVVMTYSADDHQNFKGWRPTEDTAENITPKTTLETPGIYPNNTQVTLTGDVVLAVDAPRGNWLVYHANARGATFNAPQFYLANENTEIAILATVDNMERNGYTLFETADGKPGWYTLKSTVDPDSVPKDAEGYYIIDDNYFELFEFGGTLTDNVDIYAKWKENDTARYTVVCHTQNYERTGYDMAHSYSGSGYVHTNIPYTFVNNGVVDYVTGVGYHIENGQQVANGHYTGFCLREDCQNVQVEITPEGDARLDLYFDRIEYNIKFYIYRRATTGNQQYSYALNSNAGQNVWGVASWNNTNANSLPSTTYGPLVTETTATNNYVGTYFVLTAYYGEDINQRENVDKRWPRYDQITGPDATHSPVSFVMMNGAGLKGNGLNDNGYGDGRDTIKGLITVIDEGILGRTNDANGNFLVVRFNQYSNWTYNIYFEAVPGQTYPGGTVEKTINGVTKTYYKDHEVSSRSSNTIAANQNPPSFQGYAIMKNANGTEYQDGYGPANVPQQSPRYNENVYLNYYYERLVYPITFMDGSYVTGNSEAGSEDHNNGQKAPLEVSREIAQGAEIPDDLKNYVPALPAGEEGYVFEGWYADETCTIPYTFSTMPIGGITVYAKWRQVRYRVFLHSEAFLIDSKTGEPIVDTEGNKVYDDSLDWGSDDQAMAFGIAYGGKVSLPDGNRDEYEFLGWFRDENCTNLYSASTELNDTTVLAEPPYIKSEEDATEEYPDIDYTDYLDKHGNIDESLGTPYNSDAGRFWVTRKLDLYGKWRKILVGSEGIGVVYDEGELGKEGTAPADHLLYVEGSGAVAQPASTPADADKFQFLYWVVQRWDETEGEYVDIIQEDGERVEVYPGDSFEVSMDFARRVENGDHSEVNPSYTYTMQLRAEYGPLETPKNTYFNWYRNWDENDNWKSVTVDTEHGGLLHHDEGLQINQAVTIFTLEEGIPTRPGYKFLGWARDTEVEVEKTDDGKIVVDDDGNPVKIQVTDADGNPVFDDDDNPVYTIAYHELDADDLYIRWVEDAEQTDPETGEPVIDPETDEPVIIPAHYETRKDPEDPESWVPVTKAAADEISPYQAFYAVWEEGFYVFHSSDGTVDAYFSSDLDENGKFDITKTVKDKYLYGGYFTSYFNVTDEEAIAAAGQFVDGKPVAATKELYDGSALYKKLTVEGKSKTVRYWTKANAYGTEPKSEKLGGGTGTAMEPKMGVVYYLREIPREYLDLLVQAVYDWSNGNNIDDLYLITTVDNNIYSEAGFKIVTEDKQAAFYASFSIQSRNSSKVTKITAGDINTIGGYVAVWDGTSTLITDAEEGSQFTVLPYWITMDEVRVDDDYHGDRTFDIGDKTYGGEDSMHEVKD